MKVNICIWHQRMFDYLDTFAWAFERDIHKSAEYIVRQRELLISGVRDVRISDNAAVGWIEARLNRRS